MTFNVTGNKLNAILNQRSQDMLTANNWNVVQYAALTHMMAQVSGLEALVNTNVIKQNVVTACSLIIFEYFRIDPAVGQNFQLSKARARFGCFQAVYIHRIFTAISVYGMARIDITVGGLTWNYDSKDDIYLDEEEEHWKD